MRPILVLWGMRYVWLPTPPITMSVIHAERPSARKTAQDSSNPQDSSTQKSRGAGAQDSRNQRAGSASPAAAGDAGGSPAGEAGGGSAAGRGGLQGDVQTRAGGLVGR